MSRYWSAVVGGLAPYVPGEQPKVADLVKLNTNEHPLGPSPRAIEAIRDAADDRLRLYPDPASERLRNALAHHHGVTAANIFVGNGSDEVLAHVFLGLLKQAHGPLRFPDISYSFYPVYCGLYGIDYETVPLDETFRIRREDYTDGSRPAGGIIFPNPNAPTGVALARGDVEFIVQQNPQAVVVVDEAYVDFGAESAVPLVSRYENLLTVHTLSKSRSLAGLRVGYAVGHADLITGLERVKNSFNSYPIDRLAEAGAVASIEDEAYFAAGCRFVIEQRETLTRGLTALGFEVLPSSANFVFARLPGVAGADIAAFLRQRNIIVRHFAKDRIADFLRITVGHPTQTEALLTALDQLPGRSATTHESLRGAD